MNLPTVTIAMPIYNRAYCIQRVLDSVYNQDYPKRSIQLIFVDNLSTDGTLEILKSFEEKKNSEYLAVQVTSLKSNIPEARNACIKNSVGNFILWWDSDVLAPDNGAVNRAVELIGGDAVLAFPAYLNGKPKTLYERIVNSKKSDWGQSFTLMRREIFDKVGMYNTKNVATEETELRQRIKKAGFNIKVHMETPCIHLKQGSPSFWKGYWKMVRRCWRQTESGEYEQMLKTGAYAQFLVYLGLPFAVLLSIFVSWIFAVLYLGLLLAYQIKKAKVLGVVTFVYYLLPGLVQSYGYVIHKAKAKIFRT